MDDLDVCDERGTLVKLAALKKEQWSFGKEVVDAIKDFFCLKVKCCC